MLRYLLAKLLGLFVTVTVALTLVTTLASADPLLPAIRLSMILAAPVAVGLLYLDFRRRNLWPLYDNLRIPGTGILVGTIVLVRLVAAVVP